MSPAHFGLEPVILGKYRFESALGEGGMGFVISAQQLTLGRRVALKFLKRDQRGNPELIQRFQREARVLAGLCGEHVARVLDVETHPTAGPFLVMEFLEGQDLGKLSEGEGPLSTARTADFVLQVCEAMAEAHAAGIVHRDLKPANLFVVRRPDGSPSIKVLDFGISKTLGRAASGTQFQQTQAQLILGTPYYMAPEQVRSGPIDARTDIWALGVILHELVSQTFPFPAETCEGLYVLIAAGEPTRLRQVRADIPPAFEQIVLRCLEKSPDARYQNAAELARALAPFASVSARASAERCERILGLDASGPSPTRASDPAPVPAQRRERGRAEGESTQSICEVLAARCKIFVDESFLLDERCARLLSNELLPALERHPRARLVLPERTHQILLQLAQGADAARALAAKGGLAVVHEFARRSRLERRGEAGEVSGERAGTGDLFMRLAYQFQLEHELAFLTLDSGTAAALLNSNRAESLKRVRRLRVIGFSSAKNGLFVYAPRATEDVSFEGANRQRLDAASLVEAGEIFLDTSSLMSEAAPLFVRQELSPALQRFRKKVFVARRVVMELENHCNKRVSGRSQEEAERVAGAAAAARSGLALLDELRRAELVDERHEAREVAGDERFFDALIQRVFVQHQKNKPLALVTQDRALATQILSNAQNLGAVQVTCGYLNERPRKALAFGALGNWRAKFAWEAERDRLAENGGEPARGGRSEPRRESNERRRSEPARATPFAIATQVYRGSTALIRVRQLPGEGGTVSGRKSGPVQLTRRLSEGGEGIIYQTSLPEVVCKIYLAGCLTEDRKAKLSRMVTRPSPAPGVCWPLELVDNAHGEFVGYLMPQAHGEVFNLAVFKKPLLEEHFPNWGRTGLVELARTTLELIRRLHALNIIIGDINPNNFMVVDERQVYLVDTDSFQIEEFPCPVGTPHFTPPELIGKSYAEVLRTKEHEVFAVATLVFMILFPGKPPYSGQGGGDVIESIQNQKFPYVTEEGERSAKPFGPYKFIWSHLHYRLREDFKEIFYHGRRTVVLPSGRGEAPSYVDRLYSDLGVYLESIRRGRHSNELFPADNRLHEDEEVVDLECAERGCQRGVRLAKAWHAEMVGRGQSTFRCATHVEINRLRRETREFATDLSRHGAAAGNTGLIDVNCAHCGEADRVASDFIAKLRSEGKSFVHRDCRDEYFAAQRRASPRRAYRPAGFHHGSRRARLPAGAAAVVGLIFFFFIVVFFFMARR